eukprot:9765253-Prorocentrum_lima.AAC.1
MRHRPHACFGTRSCSGRDGSERVRIKMLAVFQGEGGCAQQAGACPVSFTAAPGTRTTCLLYTSDAADDM